MTPLRVLSLGWGVQSWAVAAMSALGILPPLDLVIYADTSHERTRTYSFAAMWTPWLKARGVPVVTVSGGRRLIGQDLNDYTSIPAFTRDVETHKPTGMLHRQCTHDWKIIPLRRAVRTVMRERGIKLLPGAVEQWLGITFDEVERVKDSGVKYIVNRYPALEMLGSPWRRRDVVVWLKEKGLGIPVKSSCVFCPYHDRATWREIQRDDNNDWLKAVETDRNIRHARPGYLCYLAASRKPLDECDFRSESEQGQLALWDWMDDECEGICGV